MQREVHEVSVGAGELREVWVGVLEERLVQPHTKVALTAHQEDGEDAHVELANLA